MNIEKLYKNLIKFKNNSNFKYRIYQKKLDLKKQLIYLMMYHLIIL